MLAPSESIARQLLCTRPAATRRVMLVGHTVAV
jgi:hypothetical protein